MEAYFYPVFSEIDWKEFSNSIAILLASDYRPVFLIIFSSFIIVFARMLLTSFTNYSCCSSSLSFFLFSSSDEYWYFLFYFISFSCFFLCLWSSGKYKWRRVALSECKSVLTPLLMGPSKITLVTPRSRIYFTFKVLISIEDSNFISYFLFPRT